MFKKISNLFKKTYKIQINYKSGIQKTVKAYKFNINKQGGELTSVEWELASEDCMFFGINEVESIYIL